MLVPIVSLPSLSLSPLLPPLSLVLLAFLVRVFLVFYPTVLLAPLSCRLCTSSYFSSFPVLGTFCTFFLGFGLNCILHDTSYFFLIFLPPSCLLSSLIHILLNCMDYPNLPFSLFLFALLSVHH